MSLVFNPCWLIIDLEESVRLTVITKKHHFSTRIMNDYVCLLKLNYTYILEWNITPVFYTVNLQLATAGLKPSENLQKETAALTTIAGSAPSFLVFGLVIVWGEKTLFCRRSKVNSLQQANLDNPD